EYIAGGDLVGLIQQWRSRGGFPPREAAKVVLRLADTVGYAHRLNPPIVHRDLKPANVLVQKTDKGIVFKVTDFGIGGIAASQAITEARGDFTRALMGATVTKGSYTPLYASPQQMRGDPPDPRDDVYSLGVIWHQLLTADLAHGCPTGQAWQRRLTEKGMPQALLALLVDCLEGERHDRPADAAVLADRLRKLLAKAAAVAVDSSR